MTERDELWDEAQKLNVLFKMFGVEARAYSRPPRILWKTRNEQFGSIHCTQRVHETCYDSVEAWREAAHARLAAAQGT